MPTALLLLATTLLLLLSYQRLGMIHPLTVALALWAVIAVLLIVAPVNLVPPSPRIAVAITLGLTALALPALLLSRWTSRGAAGRADQAASGRLTVRVWPLAGAAAVVLALVGWGALQYRQAVSTVLGVPFDQLDSKLVRWAELYGNLVISGPVGIAQALVPLLGVLGIVGGLYHRWWWYLLVPTALLAAMQSPSRTATLTVAVTCVFFFLLLRRVRHPEVSPRVDAPSGRWRTVALFAVVGVLAIGYFGFVGQELDKSELPPGLTVASWVPPPMVQPLLYQVGGVSAFTVALDSPDASPYGAVGRSVYGIVKAAQLLGVHVATPDPFATYVNIPIDFNTYTAFGDAYFDFGLAGVLLVFLLNGVVLLVAGFWATRGHPGAVWLMSLMAAVLTATPIHMRLLDGDILIPAVVGFLVLRWVLVPQQIDPGRAVRASDTAAVGRGPAG